MNNINHKAGSIGKKGELLTLTGVVRNEDDNIIGLICSGCSNSRKAIRNGDVLYINGVKTVLFGGKLPGLGGMFKIKPLPQQSVAMQDAKAIHNKVTIYICPTIIETGDYQNVDKPLEIGMTIEVLPDHMKRFRYG